METKFDYYLWNKIIPKETCQKIIDEGLKKLENLKKEGFNPKASTFGDNNKSDTRVISEKDLTGEQLKENNINQNDVYIRDSNIIISWY